MHANRALQVGVDFVPIVFTTSGGTGEQLKFLRQYWTPHWSTSRVEALAEDRDAAMHIGKWAARQRKATWQARFAVKMQCSHDQSLTTSYDIADRV